MKKYIFILLATIGMMSAKADTFAYLNFVCNDSTITQVSTDQLEITYADGNAIINFGSNWTKTLALADLAYMEFTNKEYKGSKYDTGDLNGDGSIDVSDVNLLIDLVLGKITEDELPGDPDISGDGSIDVSDVNLLIDIILGKTEN